ncbi:hypothetical protein BDZ89DRAFT_1136223 [Hymenopellis radicata]|nr:hypothetical protein BDZ89DRAFT_1136223 [Hymenopellis radicata]
MTSNNSVHYRVELNTWAQQTHSNVTFTTEFRGPAHDGSWVAVALVNGVQVGTGISTTQNRAREAASYWALVNLGVIPPPTT